MKLESSFEVPVSRTQAWELLMDVPRVVPCMPGATLKDEISGDEWQAELAVTLGPVKLLFDTNVTRQSSDEAAGTVVLNAKAQEQRARGRAAATIESRLTELDLATRVDIATDLTLSGSVAQYGRGVVEDVSDQLVAQFAECLEAQLTSGSPEQAAGAVEQAGKPVSGLRLGALALLRRIGSRIRRLFRRSSGR